MEIQIILPHKRARPIHCAVRRAPVIAIRLAALIILLIPVAMNAADDDDLALITKDMGISLWDESFTIRTGIGYDDNVFLNNTQLRGSPFFINGLDMTILRLPVDAWEYDFFVTGDDIRYWRDVGVGSQDLWLGVAKVQRSFGDDWQAGATFSYAYQAQVLDLLTSEGALSHAPTKVIGNTISLRPFVRRTLGTNYWVELQAEGTRQFYGAPAFSYWSAGPKITLGRSYGFHSDVALSYAILDQPFDTESREALNGASLAGPRLAYLTQKVELLWRHHWDEKHVWANTARLGFDSIDDNGSGYFNYYRSGCSDELDYNAHGWTITALASFQYYDYPYQTADDPALDKLYETGFTLNLHVEKHLTKWLGLFAEYEFEHTFSNDSVEQYAVNTIKGGLLWDF